MGLTEIILLLQSVYGPDFNHDNFCQNLYFQPYALEKMEYFHCDVEKTSHIISNIQRGYY